MKSFRVSQSFFSKLLFVFVITSLFFSFGCLGGEQNPPANTTANNSSGQSQLPLPENDIPLLNISPNDTLAQNESLPAGNQTPRLNSSLEDILNGNISEDNPVIDDSNPVIDDSLPAIVNKSRDDLVSTSVFGFRPTPNSSLEIYVINVGYGESVLVKKGDFEMLVDSGSRQGGQKAVDFLRSLGLSKLEVLVATHSRPQNIGGIPDVLDAFAFEDFWNNNVPNRNMPEYADMMDAVLKAGLVVKHPQAGDSIEVNGMKITVLNPYAQRFGNNPDDTDSIVLKVKYKEFCALLMSDAPDSVESRIMGSSGDIKCQMLLVGRNGAADATLNSFILLRANPKTAVISVGPNNDNNPKQAVLEQLRILSIMSYRTDKDGTIKIESDGSKEDYKVSTNQ
ncbi:hypothetical protein FJZ26_04515 [Candidatus Parvarchaeota archaeon]|nr:hypothetical protein [Candidatus Parvarchaeota archaeon]